MAKVNLSINQIREILPHRYPMLLVDRVVEITNDEVIAEKLVSANEPFFAGHFPEIPIMPGVLIIEALAQAAGIGVRYNDAEARSRDLVLAGINRCRFRRPVVPGDVLTLHSGVGCGELTGLYVGGINNRVSETSHHFNCHQCSPFVD